MTRRSDPPGFVRPIPVYGVEQADGTVTEAGTVAEAAAAARARVAADAPLPSANARRRVGAGLIDLGLGAAVAAGLAEARPMSVVAQIGLALAVTFLVRVVVATLTGGASPGRLATGTSAVDRGAAGRLTFERIAFREAVVLFYAVFSVFVFLAWLVMLGAQYRAIWFRKPGPAAAISTAPIPQDETTDTTVATLAEIRRVRARAVYGARTAQVPRM